LPKQARKILIVEDNPGDVRLIREALRCAGIESEIQHQETADAGVRTVLGYQSGAKDVPELILLDYNLPAGTARDVLAAIQTNPALLGVKKAVLTCSVAPSDREHALAAGADVFMNKPADLDEFLNEIGSAVLDLLEHTQPEAN
jgi:two-component system, chemotaxis family, response regulator Rcp1